MSDPIDRQAAIDGLKKIPDLTVYAYCSFLDMLMNMPSAQQWIPCSERLPDTNGDYLVTGRQGAVNKRGYEDGYWYGNWSVIAWMPLPEPYKGEQE